MEAKYIFFSFIYKYMFTSLHYCCFKYFALIWHYTCGFYLASNTQYFERESERACEFFSFKHIVIFQHMQSCTMALCVYERERERENWYCSHIVKARDLLYEASNLSEIPDRSFQSNQPLISSVFHSPTFALLDDKTPTLSTAKNVCALKKPCSPLQSHSFTIM